MSFQQNEQILQTIPMIAQQPIYDIAEHRHDAIMIIGDDEIAALESPLRD